MAPRRKRVTRERPAKSISRKNSFGLNAAKMIDAAFARPIKTLHRGKTIKVSTFFAIYYQLAQKALTDRRARRVLSRYTAYAKEKGGMGKLRIVFEGAPKKKKRKG